MKEEEYYSKLQSMTLADNNFSKFNEYPQNNISNFSYHFLYSNQYAELCSKYKLQEIAQNGNTFTKAVNIMNFINAKTKYCGNSQLVETDVKSIIQYSFNKDFEQAINCEQKAVLLSEFLFSLGIFAHPIIFEHYAFNNTYTMITEIDCHVCVHIYLPEEQKWILLDPSFNAYFSDDKGNVLNIIEIKNRLKNNQNVLLSQYSLNGNTIFKDAYPSNFVYSMSFRISVWNGNSIDERAYNQNILLPNGIDKDELIRMKFRANGIRTENIEKAINTIKYISIEELLRKPQNVFDK